MAHHEPFKAIGPIAWDDLDLSDLDSFLTTTFSAGQTLIDSLPVPENTISSPRAKATGRPRSATDSAVRASLDLSKAPAHSTGQPQAGDPEIAAQLRREWKEVKVGSENPLGVRVYKLNGKDGRGAWFARRSVHEGPVPFEKWRLGLEREFAETMSKAGSGSEGSGGEPGAGNIRMCGAERRVERRVVDGKGKLEVYHLSARFPGPTTPRDFVALLLTSASDGDSAEKRKGPRQFMVVSKPCDHPECPPRQGFIRGQYASVEIIQEVPIEKAVRRTRSSIDLSRNEIKALANGDDSISKEAVVRAAKQVAEQLESSVPSKKKISLGQSRSDVGMAVEVEEPEMAIEWLMVTRSDPGGSVPRFMVERGTPNGIVSDAGRFVDWLSTKSAEDFASDVDEGEEEDEDKEQAVFAERRSFEKERAESGGDVDHRPTRKLTSDRDTGKLVDTSKPGGFYGMIEGALGAAGIAGMALVNKTSTLGSSPGDSDSESESDLDYASAEEGDDNSTPSPQAAPKTPTDKLSTRSIRSVSEASRTSDTPSTLAASGGTASTKHEKELKKLQDRLRKSQEKALQSAAKRRVDNEKEAAAAARAREKHEREMARHQERYRRDVARLEERRVAEERKAEERRRRMDERDERARLLAELEGVRAERDVARKEAEILRARVGELQQQNTMLVARMGKEEAAAVVAAASAGGADVGGAAEGKESGREE